MINPSSCTHHPAPPLKQIVIRSAVGAVCAIEAMPTSNESRVFCDYREQWLKRENVRHMWNQIAAELSGMGRSGGEAKSNRK